MRKALKWIGIGLGGLVGVALLAAAAFALIGRSRLNGRYDVPHTLPAEAVSNASVEVGARIAQTRGCFECHDQGFRGKVFVDIPPGLIATPNLTKGQGGIGSTYRTPDDWDHSVRFGVRPDGSPIFPFMPFELYRRLSDADAASLAAYLASLPPVDNQPPPLEVRPLGYLIVGTPGSSPSAKLEELSKAQPPAPPPGPTTEYGRYIASTTCVACHGENLLGGKHPAPDGPPGPELSHAGQWSLEQFTTALRTGVVPNGRQLTEWMPWRFFSAFTDDEIRALHEYLKTLGTDANGAPAT
jgi:cytochrome c553